MSASGRMEWLDTLRLFAGVSMVGLHASSDPTGQPFPAFSEAERVFPVLFRAVIYVARTELFLIISLFLLYSSLDKRPRSYVVTITEQFRRLIIPFSFWVLVYAFWRLIKAIHFGYEQALWGELSSLWSWLGYFTLGDVQYHMHFLPTLFALILFFPLARVAVDRPELGLVVLLCLLVKREADVWMWRSMQDLPGFEYLVRSVKVVTYVGYGFVAASFYGISKRKFDRHIGVRVALVFGFCGALLFGLKLIYSYRVIMAGNWQHNFTPAYWADFIMPAIMFGGIMFAGRGLWPSIVGRIAPFSFGIYLCHPLFLDLVEIAVDGHSLSPTQMVLTKVSVALVATSGLVWALSRSPLLAWTIGLGALPRASAIWQPLKAAPVKWIAQIEKKGT